MTSKSKRTLLDTSVMVLNSIVSNPVLEASIEIVGFHLGCSCKDISPTHCEILLNLIIYFILSDRGTKNSVAIRITRK